MFFTTAALTTLAMVGLVVANPMGVDIVDLADSTESDLISIRATPSCFPSIGFQMPSQAPFSRNHWWCDIREEYAFMGFSYEVSACQSRNQLKKEFLDIRQRFKGRYVRIYGTCDREGFYNDVIEAAWGAGVGVHALVWFGFDGDRKWVKRRDALWKILHTNPKAPFIVRVVQFGSEPLFDNVLPPGALAAQVWAAKANLSSLGISVTVSEMAYGFQKHDKDGGPAVMDAIDIVDAHMLPFFSAKASTAKNSWEIVKTDIEYFEQHAKGKKIYLSQNGWPSVTYEGVKPNSPAAVANIKNERDYYSLFDSKCSYFKTAGGQGIGWFAHLYSDDQEPGYGIYGSNGELKFLFSPRTSC